MFAVRIIITAILFYSYGLINYNTKNNIYSGHVQISSHNREAEEVTNLRLKPFESTSALDFLVGFD